MNEYLLVKMLHILGLVYWLGGDMGVFYSSYFVANEKLSQDVRMTTAKILFALDQAPRVCMTMMLPLGTHLAWKLGVLPIDETAIAIIWLLSFAWLGMVITLHVAPKSKGLALSTGLIVVGATSLASSEPAVPYWVAIKLMIFGGLVGCGLIVRIKLKPFGPAFTNLVRGNVSDADNAAIRQSLGATRPFVVTIWIGLLASTALGLHLL